MYGLLSLNQDYFRKDKKPWNQMMKKKILCFSRWKRGLRSATPIRLAICPLTEERDSNMKSGKKKENACHIHKTVQQGHTAAGMKMRPEVWLCAMNESRKQEGVERRDCCRQNNVMFAHERPLRQSPAPVWCQSQSDEYISYYLTHKDEKIH